MKYAITGGMGAGKTTTATYLKGKYEEAGREVVVPKFADMLYAHMYDWYEIAYGPDRATWPEKSRYFLEEYGTGIVRSIFGSDILVKSLKKRLAGISENAVVICDDCRTEPEFEMLREMGFLTIAIDCDAATRRLRAGATWREGHSTENALSQVACDVRIKNEGTLGELFHQLDHIYRKEG